MPPKPIDTSTIPSVRLYLGANVKRWRGICRLTQAQLATKVGMDRSYLSNIENASVAASIDTVERLAKEFRIQAASLLASPSKP